MGHLWGFAASVSALFTAALGAFVAIPADAAEPPIIPRSALFGNADCFDVKLAPDGARIGYLTEAAGVTRLLVRTVHEFRPLREPQPVSIARFDPGALRHWEFAQNSRQILVIADTPQGRVIEAYSIADGSRVRLSPSAATRPRLLRTSFRQPDHVLLGLNDRDADFPDVWRVDTRSGERTLVLRNERRFSDFIFDSAFGLQLAVRDEPDGSRTVLARDPEAEDAADDPERQEDPAIGPWLQFLKWDRPTAIAARPLGISLDRRVLYFADAVRDDTTGLYAFTRQRDGTAHYDAIAESETADLDRVLFHPVTERPQAAVFEGLAPEHIILDDFMSRDFAFLFDFRPQRFEIVSRDRRDHIWIVRFEDGDAPTEHFLYWRGSRRMEHLCLEHPELLAARLATPRTIAIAARDGTQLLAQLTLPLDVPPDTPLPMVLHAHDGPWHTLSRGFEPMHQFLANRGVAVLSVNYRGSRGLGIEFASAEGEWTGAVADDLIDAALWAVESRVAHPDRMVIMGEGFGGTLALDAVTFVPDFFAAAIALNPAADMRLAMQRYREAQGDAAADLREARLGAKDNPRLLESMSPVERAGDVIRPVLIGAFGDEAAAQQARLTEFTRIARENGAAATLALFPDESPQRAMPAMEHDHNDDPFAHAANRLAWAALVEAFLAEHLGTRSEPDTQAAITRSPVIVNGAR